MLRDVRALVALKARLGERICPSTFLRAVLPFWEPDAHGSPTVQYVDPGLVLGAPYQDWPAPSDPSGVMNQLNAAAERWTSGAEKGFNAAEYAQVGPMPLYVAHEGKNRVSLFAAHDRRITALVTPTTYPAARELTLHQLMPWGEWGLARREAPAEIHPLPYATVTVASLRAYGVVEGSPRWQRQLLAPLHVAARTHREVYSSFIRHSALRDSDECRHLASGAPGGPPSAYAAHPTLTSRRRHLAADRGALPIWCRAVPPGAHEVCISVADPHVEPATRAPGLVAVLRIAFDDIDAARAADDVLFDAPMADGVLEFVAT